MAAIMLGNLGIQRLKAMPDSRVMAATVVTYQLIWGIWVLK